MATEALPSDTVLFSFARGVLALIDAWPAFRIARDHRLAPDEAEDKRRHLATELVDAFATSTPAPASSDLQDFLLRFMQGECDLDLEDGSEALMARDLIALWAAPAGSEREALIAKHASRANQMAPYQQQAGSEDGSDASDTSDDEGMEVDAPTPLHPDDGGSQQHRSRQPPPVDEEGFTLVTRRR